MPAGEVLRADGLIVSVPARGGSRVRAGALAVGGAEGSASETKAKEVPDGRVLLLDRVSFGLRAGEVVALLGPNGAGKSTLLRCLSGALEPCAGSTHLAGRPLGVWHPAERARHVAVLPQNPHLAFAFTALEVVLLGRTPHCGARRPGAKDRRLAREALAAVDGEALAERIVPTLSGGEQQRVQLARALCQLADAPPGALRVLLLDEPLSGLDLCHQHASLRVARAFAAAGGAVLVSLHDLNQAAQYADRVLVLQAGRLMADGPPDAVLDPALVARVFATRTLALRHPSLPHPVLAALPEDPPSHAFPPRAESPRLSNVPTCS